MHNDDNTAIVTRNSTMAFDTSFHFAFRFILKHLWVGRLRVRFNREGKEKYMILYNLVTSVIANFIHQSYFISFN